MAWHRMQLARRAAGLLCMEQSSWQGSPERSAQAGQPQAAWQQAVQCQSAQAAASVSKTAAPAPAVSSAAGLPLAADMEDRTQALAAAAFEQNAQTQSAWTGQVLWEGWGLAVQTLAGLDMPLTMAM